MQITTHVSWVFLTDREVWKLKRPVDYGFVNYTTLDRRQRCCEEEVRLNRRLAPDVYLGVVPVRLGPEGHGFGPEGDIVDYAVRMRRLPDEASAEALVRRRALTPEHLARLAARLAKFFADADPAPSMGAIDVIRDNVLENFAQVEPFVDRFVSRETFRAVRGWQLGVLERDAGRFRARVEQGRIRDGHGDLRLEHVYFEDSDPIVIDCVEFNERLRCGDTAADVAFLAMELTVRDRRDLAELLLAGFALESDDYDLYGVVDFYVGYRAWVRGKVAAFLAADPSTPPEKASRKDKEARTLFTLARSYAETRSGAPPVIAVGGVIGTGKSTLAQALARADGASRHLVGPAPEGPGRDPSDRPRSGQRLQRGVLGPHVRRAVPTRRGGGRLRTRRRPGCDVPRAGPAAARAGPGPSARAPVPLCRDRVRRSDAPRTPSPPGCWPVGLRRRGTAARANPRGVRAGDRARRRRAPSRRHERAVRGGRTRRLDGAPGLMSSDTAELVRKGEFREDLFFRVSRTHGSQGRRVPLNVQRGGARRPSKRYHPVRWAQRSVPTP